MKLSILGRNRVAVQLGEACRSLGIDVLEDPASRTALLEVTRDPSIDALVIGCPMASRFSLALEALSFGKHVLVAGGVRQRWEASVLSERARDQRRVLDFALPALLDSERARMGRMAAELDGVRLVTARRRWDGRDWSAAWDALADEVARLHLLFGDGPAWASTTASPSSRSEEPADAVSFTLGFPGERMGQVQLLAGAPATTVLAHAAAGPVRIDACGFDPAVEDDEPTLTGELARRFANAVTADAPRAAAVPGGVFGSIEAAQRSLREARAEVALG
jgi:predicted dehydrogenase